MKDSKKDKKIYRKNTGKNVDKKKDIKKILMIGIPILLGCILVILTFAFKNKDSIFTIKESIKEIGFCKNIKGEKNSTKYNLNFPFFKVKEMDTAVGNLVQGVLSSYASKNEDENIKGAKIESDYNSYAFSNDCGASLDLHFLKKNKKEKKHTVKTMVFCYGKIIKAEDMFIKNKIKKVILAIKNEIRSNSKLLKYLKKHNVDLDDKLKNCVETLKNFILKEDSIGFYFDSGDLLPEKYGPIFVEINNNVIKDCFSAVYYKVNSKADKKRKNEIEKSKIPVVALTFDDGPNEKTTSEILDVLEKYNVRATFFVVGKMAEKYPEVLKRELRNGHEIANHTYSHAILTHLNENKINLEVKKTNNIIKKFTGVSPSLLRAPGGSINRKVKEIVKFPFIHWTVDTRDWATNSSQKTINTAIKNAADGSIILMHDINESTTKAIEPIIKGLLNRGFSFVTVSEMFDIKNIPLEPGRQYRSAVVKKN